MKTKFIKLLCLFVVLGQTAVFAGGHHQGKSRPIEVNEKLIRAFQDAFPKAEKVDWIEKENGYVVYFVENAVRSQINYDLDGNFVSAIRYYQDENLLPLHLSWQLHNKYADKTVFGVTETTSEGKTFYFIKMEGLNDWTTVKANANGYMRVTEQLGKQQ